MLKKFKTLSEELIKIFNDRPVFQTLKNRFKLQKDIEDGIKEFIRLLKEKFTWTNGEVVSSEWINKSIDNLAGDDLL